MKNEITTLSTSSTPSTLSTSSTSTVAAELTQQYHVVENAKNTMLRECIKFGTMLIQWEQYLGTSVGGRGHSGEGLKGWLETNCPEISYKSATVYKTLAMKTVKMLGGGSMVMAALQDRTEVANPSGEVIDVDAEVLEKRDALFTEATSRRQLEQMWFAFEGEAAKGHAGRPAGAVVNYVKRTPLECAVKSVWPMIDHMLSHRGELFHAYQLLPEDKLSEALATIEEQAEAIRAELKNRKA